MIVHIALLQDWSALYMYNLHVHVQFTMYMYMLFTSLFIAMDIIAMDIIN